MAARRNTVVWYPAQPTGPAGLRAIPAGTVEEPEAVLQPMYLLELARSFSLEFSSEPVLCSQFNAGVDLLVSADSWSEPSASAQAISARMVELMAAMQSTVFGQGHWCTAILSFGLVRWWPVRLRNRVFRSLGPFQYEVAAEYPSMPNRPWPTDRNGVGSAVPMLRAQGRLLS